MRRSALFFTFVFGAVGIIGCGPDPGPEPEPVITAPASPPLRSPPPPGADELVPVAAQDPHGQYQAPEMAVARPKLREGVTSELAPRTGCPALPACARVDDVPVYDLRAP